MYGWSLSKLDGVVFDRNPNAVLRMIFFFSYLPILNVILNTPSHTLAPLIFFSFRKPYSKFQYLLTIFFVKSQFSVQNFRHLNKETNLG